MESERKKNMCYKYERISVNILLAFAEEKQFVPQESADFLLALKGYEGDREEGEENHAISSKTVRQGALASSWVVCVCPLYLAGKRRGQIESGGKAESNFAIMCDTLR